jgi:hypothetical protein
MADRSEGIKITGARELRKALKQAEDHDLQGELKRAYQAAGKIVADSSKIKAPVRSGDLRASIRPLGGATRTVVAAGRGTTNVYAGVIHYGWPGHGITAQPFIHQALRSEWDDVYDTFTDAVDRVTRNI